jgi:hypothetical protein
MRSALTFPFLPPHVGPGLRLVPGQRVGFGWIAAMRAAKEACFVLVALRVTSAPAGGAQGSA